MNDIVYIIGVPILILWAAYGMQVITEFIKHTGK
jgi:hypothetical protein